MEQSPQPGLIVRALAIAAVVPACAIVLQSAFGGFYTPVGFISLLPSVQLPASLSIFGGLARFFETWLFSLAVLLVVGLPVCLLCRRFGLVQMRYFAVAGLVAGIVLAYWTSAAPLHPHLVEYARKTGAALYIRKTSDVVVAFLQGFLTWLVVWKLGFSISKRRQVERLPLQAAPVERFRFVLAALILSLAWYPVLFAMPAHSSFITGIRPAVVALLLGVTGLAVAWPFRRRIVRASRAGSILLGCTLPFLCALVFLILLNFYLGVMVPQFRPDAALIIVLMGLLHTLAQFPLVVAVGIGIQFALRWAGRPRQPAAASP